MVNPPSSFDIFGELRFQSVTDEWKTYAGPVGIVVGLLHGILVGICAQFIPPYDIVTRPSINVHKLRNLLAFVYRDPGSLVVQVGGYPNR